ncbi:BspA family leucine-rich repeat surface protein [uncultured Aquimarina sp.]|uniref:BspA family leucine-rich repeat surface protein n=1 Tax=uncultured Aquimarina sp. TaxID=575652 RepID=UPI00260BC348|nr:BspA family leucine-rich repeat surface protein [uncultured Aquimarina sp.]
MKHFYITLFFIVSFLTAGFAQSEFITTWQTTTANESITIPTTGSGYNYTVDWGDGTIENGLTGNATHEYAIADTYTVEITGDFPRIYFANSGDKDKIRTIEQWGTIRWTSMGNAFDGCSQLILNADDTPDLSLVNDLSEMFSDASSLVDTKGSIGNWDVSTVNSMTGMFASANNFGQDLGNWDISSVTSMVSMFFRSGLSTENYDATLIGWATLDAGETIPTNIFVDFGSSSHCIGTSALNILTSTPNNWTILDRGFNCDDSDAFITTWRISSNNETITIPTTGSGYEYYVDWGDGSVETIETGNATHQYTSGPGDYQIKIWGDFPRIYFNNTGDRRKIFSIDNWGTNKWQSFESAFNGATNLVLNATDIPDLSEVENLSAMFQSTTSFDDIGGRMKDWDVSNVNYMTAMFAGSNFNEDIGNWDLSNITNGSSITFLTLSEKNYVKLLTGWGTDTSGIDGDGIDDIPRDFQIFFLQFTYFCLGLQEETNLALDPYNWLFSGTIIDCSDAFITTWQTTTANEPITIPTTGSGYDYHIDWGDGTVEFDLTGNATHEYATTDTYTVKITGDFPRFYSPGMGGYFTNAAKIQSIEQWGTQQWESMENAFDSTTNLVINAIDVPDLSMVTSMQGMFFLNSSLVDNGSAISTWDVSNVQDMGYLFRNTPFNEDISSWNTQNVTNMSNMLANCPNFDQNLGNWDINSVTNMSDMLVTSGLSLANYDATLLGWATDSSGNTTDGIDDIPVNITFHAGSSSYCLGVGAHNTLTSAPYNWTISDDGTTCAPTDFFITTWQTTSDNESITIPTFENGYNYSVDWGDGTVEYGFTGNASHEYATAGTYVVKINGDFPRIYFSGNTSIATKILSVEQWGTIAWNSMSDAFNGCSNLVINATDAPDLSNVVLLSQMFAACTSLTNEDFNHWNLSNVTKINGMFTGATNFNGSINEWDVSNVDNMEAVFGGTGLFNRDLSDWDVSNVVDMGFMFFNATGFDQSLGAWDISSLRITTGMFSNVGLSTASYDATLMGWASLDTGETQIPTGISIVTNHLTYCLGVDAHNTLTSAPYNWSITDAGTTCASTDFFITTWEIATNNEEIALPITDTGLDFIVDWGDGMITNETEEAYHTYANAGTYTIRISGNFNRMRFNGNADRNKIQTIEQWGSNTWTSMEDAFNGCTNLEVKAVDSPDLSNVTSLESMFRSCHSLDKDFNVDFSGWDTSSIQDFTWAFTDAIAFNSSSITNWDVSEATRFDFMFLSATSFDQDLSQWDISSATSMDTMLRDAGMSTENYDATLIGWATLETGETQIPSDIVLDVDATYCLGEAARNTLTSTLYNWLIFDEGTACAATDFFITTWQTTTANEVITIPIRSAETYNYSVDWGDGILETGFTGNATHTFATAGIKTIKIIGDFPAPFFRILSNDDKGKLLTIEQWGTQRWTTMNGAFGGCYNLKLNANDIPDLSQVTTIADMFRDCTNFEDLKDNMNSWDVSNIERISYMFNDCIVFNENIGNWTFTKLKSSFSAFNGASAFNQDISNWNMSTVEDMESMFKDATSFNQPIGNWTLGVVDYINDFFAGATSFNQDLSAWDFSNVYEAYDMFNGATSFNQDLSAWDISNVESLDNFFIGSGMSQENYDNTLIGWATLESGETQIPANLTLDATVAHCLSIDAVNTLTNAPYNWTINDGGQGCVDPVITLLGDNPQVIERGDAYTELGAEVTYGAIVTINATSVNTDVVGSYSVAYDAVNTVSGATATQVTRTVEVVDTTAPVITLNGLNPQIIELGDPYVELGATTDDGSPVTLDTNIGLLVSDVGTYSAMYFAVDAYGNSSTVFRTVEVVDTTAPVITLSGANPQIIELGDPYVELGATTDDGSPVTLDTNIGLLVSDVGTYSAMYFAVDAYGNSSTIFRTVEVVDTTAPVITLNGPNPQIIELGNPYVELGATTDDGSPVTLDTNIGLLVSDVGAYSAMYFAADASGNSSTVFRTVEVVDTTNPTVVCQNITVQLDDTGNASITAAIIDNGSTDLSGIASLAIDVTDFDCTNVGDNMVTLTVTDANGNTDMCMATVTVEDSISPEFDITTVPTDMEVPFDTGDMYTLADFTTDVVVTDNCDSNSVFATTITQSPVAGTLLAAGDHVITLIATDDNSNIETVSFTITVSAILSVEENEEYLFTIYPNPAKDQVWITGLQGEAEVTISDINGRILRTIKVMNDQAISTTDLSEGVYLITIEQNDINQTMRLMKN